MAAGGAMTGLAIFNTIFGIYQASQEAERYDAAAAEAERIGRQNAAASEAETQERLRVTELEQASTEASAKARAAASGVVGGSLESSITTMATEHGRQLAWMKVSGASEARSALTKGQYAGAAARAQASATRGRGISEGISGGIMSYRFGKKYTDWWD
jgi:hypothetical protein